MEYKSIFSKVFKHLLSPDQVPIFQNTPLTGTVSGPLLEQTIDMQRSIHKNPYISCSGAAQLGTNGMANVAPALGG